MAAPEMSGGPAGRRLPVTAGRPWPAWVLAMIATRRRAALGACYLAGLGLLAWIAVQLLVLQRYFFLQPVIAVLGLAETGLAWLWQRTEGRRSSHNRDLRPSSPGKARG